MMHKMMPVEYFDEALMRHKKILLSAFMLVSMGYSLILSVQFLLEERTAEGLLPLIVVVLVPLSLYYLYHSREGYIFTISSLSGILFVSNIFAFYLLFDQSSYLIWFAAAPILYLFLLGIPLGLFVSIALGVAYAVIPTPFPDRLLVQPLHFWLVYLTVLLLAGFQAAELHLKNRVMIETTDYDLMTGMYNRRAFLQLLELEIRRMNQHEPNGSLSLILFDIDHFHVVNDRFGHDAGDQVLKEYIGIVKSWIRKEDILARWVDESFIVALRNVGLDSALLVTEKLRSKIEHHRFDHIQNLTSSFGAVEYRKGDTSDDLINRVTRALMNAQGNRNHIFALRDDL